MTGRPTKLTPAVQKRICQAIELGATYELAAKYGGISHETFVVWRKNNPAFSEAIENAEGAATVKWLTIIQQAASEGNWQAAAWKLERRYPESFGRKEKHEHSGAGGGPIEVKFFDANVVLTAITDGSAADR